MNGLSSTSTIEDLNKFFCWDGESLSRTMFYLIGLEEMMIPGENPNIEAQKLDVQKKLEFN